MSIDPALLARMKREDYRDLMFDCETTGTLPDRHAMIQISAVRFDLSLGVIDSNDMFNKCMTIPKHRHWDQECLKNFWLKNEHRQKHLDFIMTNAEPWQDVMQEFADWIGDLAQPFFWSKPTHFDWGFLASYFHDAGIKIPMHYRYANDLNSFIRGYYYPNRPKFSEKDIPVNEENRHNALYDSIQQIGLLFKVVADPK